MKAVVLAYHNIGCVGLEALLRHGFDVQAVFTHKDDPGERIWFNSVAELADSIICRHSPLPTSTIPFGDRIREMQPDIIFRLLPSNGQAGYSGNTASGLP